MADQTWRNRSGRASPLPTPTSRTRLPPFSHFRVRANMSMDVFSSDSLAARLRMAREGIDGRDRLNWAARFAGLAIPITVLSADEVLRTTVRWPLRSYAGAPRLLEIQVLEWLVTHAQYAGRFEAQRGWVEQWQFRLSTLRPPTGPEADVLAAKFVSRPYSADSRALFEMLLSPVPTGASPLAWIDHLARSGRLNEIVDETGTLLERSYGASIRAGLRRARVEALLRRASPSVGGLSDPELAIHELFSSRKERLRIDGYDELLCRATAAALPTDLCVGRGERTNFVADAYRGLTRGGKRLGGIVGGRDAQVPWSAAVVASAPRALAPAAVEAHLAGSHRYRDEMLLANRRVGTATEAISAGGTLTLQGLWTLAQVDSSVLKALEFASAGHPDSFWQLRDVAEQLAGNTGATTRISGYVAEQKVALDLARDGHIVQFPDSPNQIGYDLLVDGHPVQVKCTLSADHVLDHIQRYPDIPVIVNSELAAQLGDHPMVWVDHALQHATISDHTASSTEALAGFGDVQNLMPIPFLALGFAAFRNLHDFQSGVIDARTYTACVGLDAGFRTVGGGVGSAFGATIGSALGPLGSVFGAGVGAFVGSVVGGTGGDSTIRRELCDARDAVVARLAAFAGWFKSVLLVPRRSALEAQCAAFEAWAQTTSLSSSAPASVAFFVSASAEAARRAKSLEEWLLQRLGGDDFDRAHAGWVALREANGFFHPELKTRVEGVEAALNAYLAMASPATPDGWRRSVAR